jgi:hypothetical protein
VVGRLVGTRRTWVPAAAAGVDRTEATEVKSERVLQLHHCSQSHAKVPSHAGNPEGSSFTPTWKGAHGPACRRLAPPLARSGRCH